MGRGGSFVEPGSICFNLSVSLLSQRGRAMLRVSSFNSTIPRAQFSITSYFRFRFKLCSVLFVVVVHTGCDKQDSLMRGDLCGKLHRRPSVLFALHQYRSNSQIFVENRDFHLCPPAFDAPSGGPYPNIAMTFGVKNYPMVKKNLNISRT